LPDTETLSVPATNPYSPFGAPALVAYSFLNTLGPVTFGGLTRNYLGTLGARWALKSGWRMSLLESYGRETLFDSEYNIINSTALNAALGKITPGVAFNPFSPAANTTLLASIRRKYDLHATSQIETTHVAADGPIFALPGGDAKLALGWERREEAL